MEWMSTKNSLIKDAQRDPYNGIGKLEPLKEKLWVNT